MFKDKNSEEIGELKQLRSELLSPKIETEEKLLSEEESLDWLVGGINKKIRERICAFFSEDETRSIEDYELSVDNEDGKVILKFMIDFEVVHEESFKA